MIGFGPSTSSYYPDMITELDNIYISPTRARVELSDSAVWDPSSNREMQAVYSWSQSQVKVDLRQGGIASLSNAYLYVINSNNEPSAAYRLNCESRADTSPPVAPAAFTATKALSGS